MNATLNPIRLGIVGFGGLGRGMARRIFATAAQDIQLVAVVDSHAWAYDAQGLPETVLQQSQTVSQFGQEDATPLLSLLQAHGSALDALFLAFPNLPVARYSQTVEDILGQTNFRGVMVDALKRTAAVERLLPLDAQLQQRGVVYITGAGATPGFLTTIAAVAALSFTEVCAVEIRFGVGVANWEQYRATIREDFLHLPGFTAQRVAAMSDADIEAELDARHGLLELVQMEHADDIILSLAGVCDRSRITVGGVVDTRNARKPVSTTVTVVGKTQDGQQSTHTFVVGDETTMVDNVCGPAVGFLRRGAELQQSGRMTGGLFTSAELMPRLAPLTRGRWEETPPAVASEKSMALVS
jgi:hypothetical protein